MPDIKVNIVADNRDALNKLQQVQNAATGMGRGTGQNFANGISAGAVALGTIVGNLAQQGINAVMGGLNAGIARADTLNAFPRVLENIGIASEDTEAALDKIVAGIDGLPTSLDSAAAAVQRFTLQNGDVGRSADMFLALNNAMLGGGANAQRQATAIEQVAQAYAKGKPDMMEWRAMLETMGPAINMVAEAMGTTSTDLGEALRSGKLSMDDFMDALIMLQTEGVGEFSSLEEQAQVSMQNIGTAMANISNRIAKAWESVINAIGAGRIVKLLDSLSNGFKDFVSSNIAPYIEKLVGLFDALSKSGMPPLDVLLTLLMRVSNDAANLLKGAFESLSTALPGMMEGIVDALGGLSDAFFKIAPVIGDGLSKAVSAAVGYMPDIAVLIADFVVGRASVIASAIGGMAPALGAALGETIVAVAQRIPEYIPIIAGAAVTLLGGAMEALAGFIPVILEALPGIITSVGESLIAAFNENAPTLLQGATDFFLTILQALVTAAPQIVAALVNMLPQLVTTLIAFIPNLAAAARQLIGGLIGAIPTMAGSLVSAVTGLISRLPGIVLNFVASMVNAGFQLILGIRDGIANAAGAIADAARNAVRGAINAAKDFLGIASPSKLARDLLGKNIVLGVAVGLEKNEGLFDDAVQKTFALDLQPSVVGAGALTKPMINVTFDDVSLNGVPGVTRIVEDFLWNVERTVGSYVG